MISHNHFITHQKSESNIQFHHKEQNLSIGDWSSRVQKLTKLLQQQPQQQWLLFESDLIEFSVLFFALLCADKQVILPPTDKPKLLKQLLNEHRQITATIGSAWVDGTRYLSTLQAHEQSQNIQSTQTSLTIKPDARIDFFTSGSSGNSKKITKLWSALNSEVNQLDSLWGESIQATTIVATVSHQHVYGLLFRLLWPLLKGYPIDTQLIHYPESLINTQNSKLTLISSPAFLTRTAEQSLWAEHHTKFASIYSSGGPLPTQTAQQIATQLGFAPIEVYGSTETGGIAWRDQKQQQLWQVFPPINIRTNEQQRLEIQSPYLDEPFHQHQWYITDDRVKIISDGQFELLGRADRIVKIEEKRLSLDQLEQTLVKHQFVAQCHCLVLDNKRQHIAMVVVLTPSGKHSLAQQKKHQFNQILKKHLDQFFDTILLPRKWRYIETLPINSQGKLVKQQILELFTQR